MIEINLLTPQHRYGTEEYLHKTMLRSKNEIYLSGLVPKGPVVIVHVKTCYGHPGYYSLNKVHNVVVERDN